MAAIEKDRILAHRGGDLFGTDGAKIGSLEEIYLDAGTGEPEWALVNTGLFGNKRTFVPLRDAGEADGNLTVPMDKARVKEAPQLEPGGQLTEADEAELYRHYGIEPPPAAAAAGESTPPAGDAS